ncbi:TonB-dependent receptor [Belliella sp. DSM 111904]|uniref:TonB-dependent receptor n=1 Tax=Belliella filtrata TaxID=2923435 RepID=A0ABS9UWP1_9BACT|nr:TonB-dependent receptor [Belliella filtrata]MCH7408582.1 TonB-dependent receptor [Belliella filtrata]
MKINLTKVMYKLSKYFAYCIALQLLTLNFVTTTSANGQYKPVDQVNIQMKQGALTLEQFFNLVESKTPYVFAYDKRDVKLSTPIKLTQSSGTVESYLAEAAQQAAVSFRQINNSIDVKKSDRTTTYLVSVAEEIRIRGKVTDSQGEPLPGVTVVVQGATSGTVTDIDGNYAITAQEGQVLQFSFVGMEMKRVTVGNSEVINVTLEEDQKTLEEFVVVGYGTQREKDLTSSIATVKTEDIVKTPNAQAMQSLQGRVAGVQIVSNGAPGASPTVRVRGVGSFQGEGAPLYVVDGMFFSNIDFLSPGDIENINILKDASAAAIYGVRAANGVVLIETKSGKYNQKPEIIYDGYVGIQNPQNVLKMANAQQFVRYINETGSAADIAFIDAAIQRYGRSRIDPSLPDVNTDWYSEVMSPAAIQNHSLTFNGGGEKTRYSIGGSYFDQNGLLNEARNEYKRLNFRVKVDSDVRDWLTVGANVNLSTARQYNASNSAWFRSYFAVPILPVFDELNTGADAPRLANAQQLGYRGNQNPFYSLLYSDSRNHVSKVMGNFYADFELIPNKLQFKTAYNYNVDLVNVRGVNFAFNDGITQNQSNIRRSSAVSYNQIMDNFLTYTDGFGKHTFTTVLGQSFRTEYGENLFASGQGLNPEPMWGNEQFWYLANATNYNENDIGDGGYKLNYLSFFGRLAYNYDDRYLLYATFRRDGNNKFQEKWGNFATFGAGWVLSSESFFNVDAVDFLKFRASWGQLGNDGISPSVGRPVLQDNNVALNNAFIIGRRLNPTFDLIDRWETTVETNFGINARFLRDRLSLDADYFVRDTRNLAVQVIPPVFRASERRSVGEIRNTGVEVSLGWDDQVTNDFSYFISGNFATLKNSVLSLGGPEYLDGGSAEFRQRSIIGQPISAFYGYEVIGVFQNQADITNSGYNEAFIAENNLQPGDLIFKDLNGDGIINDEDRKVLGSYLPTLTYGFNAGFRYKNWDFSALFQGQSGFSILNRKRGEIIFTNDTNIDADLAENMWRGEGTSNQYPSAAGLRKGWNQNMSTYFIEDGSYFRIQNVRMAYTIKDKPLFGKTFPETRISVTAERPLTLFNYNGFNPEVANGIDREVYPIPAIYTVGLNVKF